MDRRNLLAGLTTDDLVAQLATRDLVRSDGLVIPSIWSLRTKLGAIPCVDGIPVEIDNDGNVRGLVIRRRTGKFPNKLALVGGVVALNESIESAMFRHFKADLNIDIALPLGWDHPVCMRQYAPQIEGENLKDFCHDPGKHSYASTHLVEIVGDKTKIRFGEKIGGTEAMDVEWHNAHSCPHDDQWSYNMRSTFLEVLEAARLRFISCRLR